MSYRHGKSVLTNSASPTVASWTRLTTRHCRFEIPTTSHLSSSHLKAKTGRVPTAYRARPSHPVLPDQGGLRQDLVSAAGSLFVSREGHIGEKYRHQCKD